MKAFDHLPIDTIPKVYIDDTKLVLAAGEKGLFAAVDIEPETPVVIYYGDKLEHNDVFNIYNSNKEEYVKISPYLRGNGDNIVINGYSSKQNVNGNLLGVYVNDRWSLPPISKANLKSAKAKKEYNKYISMGQKNNLYSVETEDYPVYYSKKHIKKGEELYVSYGIGYWLKNNGIEPEDIYDLKKCGKINLPL